MDPNMDLGTAAWLYKVLYKGVNNAARPPEGCPAVVGGLSASSLLLLDNTGWGRSQQQINAVSLTPVERIRGL